MNHVLGIDAGGTKTVCQLADDSGRTIAEARGRGANLQAVGELGVEKVLYDVIAEALGNTGIRPAAVCLGIAGVDRPEDEVVVRGIMRRIGYPSQVLIVNDALVALEAGAPGQPGVVIVSGTGSIVYGRDDAGRAARAGGWGHVLGDEGSGYWLGRAALRAVLREADQRGPRTALTGLLLTHFEIDRVPALLHQVYHHKLTPAAFAALARYVEAAFRCGDDAAGRILATAASELEAAGLSVARRLHLLDTPFAFVLSGGIFRAVPWLAEELARRLAAAAATSMPQLLAREPAAGAVALALGEARGATLLPVYTPG